MALRTSRRTRWATASLSVVLVGALALTSTPSSAQSADSRPADAGPAAEGLDPAVAKISATVQDRLRRGNRRQDVFVTLQGPGAAEAARTQAGSEDRGRSAARSRRAQVGRSADQVVAAARRSDRGARQLFTVANAVPGVAVRADQEALEAIAGRDDVVAVAPLPVHTVANASAVQLTDAVAMWHQRHDNLGRGVRVGIIDTGIDHTHAMFGGVGTRAAFEAEDPTAPDWYAGLPGRAQAKLGGGHDFVGDDYDASDPASSTPRPDPNPLDCNGHGTHVGGTTAGYGVTAAGETFTGRYSRLDGTALDQMRIGPGVAPAAVLYGLKVFGCEGSTNVTMQALDWALDPNGDGDFDDRLDIVNMSLGSTYSPADDPLSATVAELAEHGVLTVASAGNSGDLTSVGGNPGNAPSALSVGSSVDAMQLRDGLHVEAPAALADTVAGQVSVAYDWAGGEPVTGDVVTLSEANADGCDPLSAEDAGRVAGKVAWLEWDDVDATRRCGSAGRAAHVAEAGGIGAVFTSELDLFAAGILGVEEIPVFQLTGAVTRQLRPAAETGTLRVTFDGDLIGSISDRSPSIEDTISSFTSRGEHGSDGVTGPTVTAPGDTITSAGVGTGDDQLTISGTSMAAPHVAGVAALVRSARPGWSVLQVKAAIMNTAVHDLWTGPDRSGQEYGPIRVGSGRVDAALAATTDLLAYSPRGDLGASVAFAPVFAGPGDGVVRRSQTIRVENTAGGRRAVRLSYEPVVSTPGISYDVTPRRLTLPSRGSATATVTMTVERDALRHTIDPTMETHQLGVPRQYVSDASGRVVVTGERNQTPALRVPVVGTATPASATTAQAADGELRLTGTGVAQGSGSTAYRSLVSVMELGERSDVLPECSASTTEGCLYNESSKAGDLAAVGAGSDDSMVWFGVASHGSWVDIGSWLEANVYLDTDGDGTPDFVTFTLAAPGDLTADLQSAYTVDLASGAVVDIQPLNFNWGDVHTGVFDSEVAVLPVSKAALGIGDEESFPISYTVGTYDYVQSAPLDSSSSIAFDANAPTVAVDGPLFLDEGGVSIGYRLAEGVTDAEALVLHLHGLPGERAEVVDLTP